MPIDSTLQLAMKDGALELSSAVTGAHRDAPESFGARAQEILFEHQLALMTDPTLLDPPELEAASVLVSREPLPPILGPVLTALGFEWAATDDGGRATGGLFRRLGRGRSRLERWRTPYQRARAFSPRLAHLEASLIDDPRPGPLAATAAEGSRALVDAARTGLRVLLAPGLKSLGDLERLLLEERARASGRWVLHPALVRALAAFTGETVRAEADAEWLDDPDAEAPLVVAAASAGILTDPEFRVVRFLTRGARASLTAYVEDLLDAADGARESR
jgi:hypothetical protein